MYNSIVTGRQLLKIMKKNGWILDRVSGSHHVMIKEARRSIPVPVHSSRDLPKGLVSAILKQAGITGIQP